VADGTDLRTTLRTHLTTALRERDRPLAAALRSAIAALENAEAVAVEAGRPTRPEDVAGSEHVAGATSGMAATEAVRRDLSPAEEVAVLAREVAELHEAAATFGAAGAEDRAAEATRAATVLDEVLQQQAR
jgi:uncharacterized protein